jgi:hypothetical protein
LNIFVCVVLDLMFDPGGNKGKVPGCKIMVFQFRVDSLIHDENAVS